MKNSNYYENIRNVKTVKDLKKILQCYSDDTELVGEVGNGVVTELYVGETNPIGDRDTEETTILIFGGYNANTLS